MLKLPKPESIQHKDKWSVNAFRICKVHAKILPLLELSMGIHVTQIRPHSWLIIPCIINEFEKITALHTLLAIYHLVIVSVRLLTISCLI